MLDATPGDIHGAAYACAQARCDHEDRPVPSGRSARPRRLPRQSLARPFRPATMRSSRCAADCPLGLRGNVLAARCTPAAAIWKGLVELAEEMLLCRARGLPQHVTGLGEVVNTPVQHRRRLLLKAARSNIRAAPCCPRRAGRCFRSSRPGPGDSEPSGTRRQRKRNPAPLPPQQREPPSFIRHQRTTYAHFDWLKRCSQCRHQVHRLARVATRQPHGHSSVDALVHHRHTDRMRQNCCSKLQLQRARVPRAWRGRQPEVGRRRARDRDQQMAAGAVGLITPHGRRHGTGAAPCRHLPRDGLLTVAGSQACPFEGRRRIQVARGLGDSPALRLAVTIPNES